MSEKRINEELTAVEAVLATLKPAASSVDRDRVMFLAGRASAVANVQLRQHRKTQWLWPCVTAVSLLLAIFSSGILFMQGTATGDKLAAYFQSDKAHKSENIPPVLWYPDTHKTTGINQKHPRLSSGRDDIAMDYLTLNRLIAEKGVEALPGPSWIPIGPEKLPRRDLIMRGDEKMF